jgi:serine/threonine protein kinase
MAARTIGEYRVVRELGRGGMGAVYLAEDPLLARSVAIKVIDGFADDPSARARFLIEARAIARLNHPNVVAIYRIAEHDGQPYLVSEYVDGVALDRTIHAIAPDQRAAIRARPGRGPGGRASPGHPPPRRQAEQRRGRR